MKFTLIGDIHNDQRMMNYKYMPNNSIQVGDFGFFYDDWTKTNERLINSNNSWKNEKRFFISGNHENYTRLNENNDSIYQVETGLYHIPRGFVSGEVLFIGGADSIDKDHRKDGIDWFSDESINYAQFNSIMETVKGRDIRVVIAHDLPYNFYPMVGIPYERVYGSHCKALQEIYNAVKPKLWFCGHHHKRVTFNDFGATFRVLDIGEKLEVELDVNEEDFK